MHFTKLPIRWDEAVPLGNGIMGILIWQKDGKLRLSIDRADLWDLRQVKKFGKTSYSYQFICEAIEKKNFQVIHDSIYARRDGDSTPTKLPAGAIEFGIAKLGEVKSVYLDVHTAICTIIWKNGTIGRFFTNAVDKKGYFQFTNLPDTITANLEAPAFDLKEGEKEGPNSLSRLGYRNGKIVKKGNHINYRQEAYGDVSYEIDLKWEYSGNEMSGSFWVVSNGTWYSESPLTIKRMRQDVKKK